MSFGKLFNPGVPDMSRRGILQAFTGLVGATTVGKVEKAVGYTLPLTDIHEVAKKSPYKPETEFDKHDFRWALENTLNQFHEAAENFKRGYVDPSITTKKSWSESFKIHCIAEDQKQKEKIIEAIMNNRVFMKKMAKAMGLELNDD